MHQRAPLSDRLASTPHCEAPPLIYHPCQGRASAAAPGSYPSPYSKKYAYNYKNRLLHVVESWRATNSCVRLRKLSTGGTREKTMLHPSRYPCTIRSLLALSTKVFAMGSLALRSYERHFLAPLPLYLVPPPMDLGRFEISKGPSNRGGLDLGLFEKSNRPSWRGCVIWVNRTWTSSETTYKI